MKPLRLYIENFMCYEFGYIDFTQFNSALIVGKVDNSDLYSNGVGKTTIFKAIEYVLFNQSDINLERIIRDDCEFCAITLDFLSNNSEYRIIRKRSKKSTDFSLYVRTQEAEDESTYHSLIDEANNIYKPVAIGKENKFWKDLSGSRASDTEKELDKLIKISIKSFRSTIHFIQNDFGGLATATPEKRKTILKDALNIIVYSKLEKIAKEKYNVLTKDIEKFKTILNTLGDPASEIISLEEKSVILTKLADEKTNELNKVKTEIQKLNENINDQTILYSSLETKFSELLAKKKSISLEKTKLENSVAEYSTKKNNAIKIAKTLIEDVKTLKEQQKTLLEVDLSKVDLINEDVLLKKEKVAQLNLLISQANSKCEELKIPVPDDSVCKHCRQTLSEDHKKECLSNIAKELSDSEALILSSRKEVKEISIEIQNSQQLINSLNSTKKQIEDVALKLTSKDKEIQDKKVIYSEYSGLLEKFTKELKDKELELNNIEEELKISSIDEANVVKSNIDLLKKEIAGLNSKVNFINGKLTEANNNKAVILHNIDQKNKDILKINDVKKELIILEDKVSIYPEVIQGFSTTGIPNLIIQNVLDDLQIEANSLLEQLKPGLQLSFFVEKTAEKTKDISDTLEINYQINGRDRYYEQLSGAQKIAITFSLKLGLSFLLQKMIGTEIKFLMLDEIDQSLDKASIDTFAEIVKFFQKDFTILVITHNDRLKEKMKDYILVKQDSNMVSRASVASTW